MYKIKIKNKKLLSVALIGLVIIGGIIYKVTARNADIAVIQDEAKKYFATNKNYGFSTKPGDLNDCISRNIFMISPKIQEVLAKKEVTNVSCKYKIENNIVTAWSVSLIEGEAVYCGDSIGNNLKTPGITTTPNCKAE